MKTREDFVSNSSSSSFILNGGDVKKGVELLKLVAQACEIPWEIENEISLHAYVKNKDYQFVSKAVNDEYRDETRSGYWYDWPNGEADSEKVAYDSINVPFSCFGLEKLTDEIVEKIDHIEFYLDDGHSMKQVLKLLYLFFERNGLSPDAFDTEQNFLNLSDEEKFMRVLVFGPEGIERK